MGRIAELDVEFEILELAGRRQIGPTLGIDQHSVHHAPVVLRPQWLPALQVASIQQRDGPAPRSVDRRPELLHAEVTVRNRPAARLLRDPTARFAPGRTLRSFS